MNNEANKTKILIITNLCVFVTNICLFITICITMGIFFNNYSKLLNYKPVNTDKIIDNTDDVVIDNTDENIENNIKILYLTNFFDVNGELGLSVEDKIERSVLWDSVLYTDKLDVEYRDPDTKEVITSTATTNDEARHANATFVDHVLHLPRYFDVHLYQMVTESVTDKGNVEYIMTYYFYFYNINYNTINDFDPQYIRMTFANGIGEESDEELQEALYEFDLNGETGNQPDVYSYTIMSENETDMLATFSLYDNAIVFEEDEDALYYVYRNRCYASYDDQNKFISTKELTFSIYYLNDESDTNTSLLNIVEGTFKAKLNEDGNVYTAEELINAEGYLTGYNKNFSNENFKDN